MILGSLLCRSVSSSSGHGRQGPILTSTGMSKRVIIWLFHLNILCSNALETATRLVASLDHDFDDPLAAQAISFVEKVLIMFVLCVCPPHLYVDG